jgi:hypothetical protein
MKVILKIYKSRKLASEACKEDAAYFKKKYGADGLYYNRTHGSIEIPGFKLLYFGDINNSAERFRGIRADIVEIIDNCVDQDVINEVIAPIVIDGELVFIGDKSEG